MIENGAVLPMFYLPPIDYFTKLVAFKPDVVFEQEEHFPKQTYRNRAYIYSPDGRQTLTVPIIKGAKNHTKTRDVKISYDFRWQRSHWMGMQTCYRSSAYFEYYEDYFVPFYEKQTTYLFDYNRELLALLLRLLKISMDIQVTDTYEASYPNLIDLRSSFTSKSEPNLQQKPYFQVFEERKGFLQNLSIIDLLFNQGPQALNYL
jgi:hypothetical protein